MILHFSRHLAAAPRAPEVDTPAADAPRLRFLVIGDNQWSRNLLLAALVGAYPIIDTALEAGAGRVAASQTVYDIIVLAFPLPRTSGPAICRQLRADGITCPIVVLDTRHDVDAIIDGLEAGADAYLVEPIAAAELRARLAVLVRRYGRALSGDPLPAVVAAPATPTLQPAGLREFPMRPRGESDRLPSSTQVIRPTHGRWPM